MWATLHEDGKLMLHSGEDPLNQDAVPGDFLNEESTSVSDSLW